MTTVTRVTDAALSIDITLIARQDDRFFPDAWLLEQNQAALLMDAWAASVARPTGVQHLEVGVFIGAFGGSDSILIQTWESATGSDGNDIYSTGNFPDPLTICPTGR